MRKMLEAVRAEFATFKEEQKDSVALLQKSLNEANEEASGARTRAAVAEASATFHEGRYKEVKQKEAAVRAQFDQLQTRATESQQLVLKFQQAEKSLQEDLSKTKSELLGLQERLSGALTEKRVAESTIERLEGERQALIAEKERAEALRQMMSRIEAGLQTRTDSVNEQLRKDNERLETEIVAVRGELRQERAISAQNIRRHAKDLDLERSRISKPRDEAATSKASSASAPAELHDASQKLKAAKPKLNRFEAN